MRKVDALSTKDVWVLGLALMLSALLLVSFTRAADKGQASQDILLQIYFKVAEKKAIDFEKMYSDVYVPAMRKQKGYVGSTLLRVYPEIVSRGIQAAATEFNYQMELVFDTEVNRTKWVASKEHSVAWPAASSLAEKFAWRGYDLVTRDVMSRSK